MNWRMLKETEITEENYEEELKKKQIIITKYITF